MIVKSCEKAEKSTVVLTVEVSAEEFEAAVERAYRKMRGRIRVPGFRPGKATRKVIEGIYGQDVFYDEAIHQACPDAFEAAVKEQNLRILTPPEVDVPEPPTREGGFTFTATVPVYPEMTLGTYKGLTAPKAEVSVTEEDVDARIQQLLERNTRLVSVEREAREGDTVVIDFEGFLDGKPFDGGKGENHSLELGSHTFVPGFEEQLVGTQAGDEKDVEITFPEDYAKELAGKNAVFKVKVQEVKEKDVPELDDEFAMDVSEFDTLAELRADLETKLRESRERDAQRAFEDALMDQVEAGLTGEIPDVMIDAQARQFVDNLKNSVWQQGLTYQQYLKMTGADEAKLLEDAREPAIRQVRMDLAVAAIIEAEHLEATDEDVAEEYERLAEDAGMDAESIKKYLTEDQVQDQVLTRKAIAVVAESSNAVKLEDAVPQDGENSASQEAEAAEEA